jgi:hypothetical protein
MSSPRTSYDDVDSPAKMRADAAAAGRALRRDRMLRAAGAGAPSLEYVGRDVAKRDLAGDESAARIANALNLYLD